jgi:hypothetical protein
MTTTGERLLDMQRKHEGEASLQSEGILCIALRLEAMEHLSHPNKLDVSANIQRDLSPRAA